MRETVARGPSATCALSCLMGVGGGTTRLRRLRGQSQPCASPARWGPCLPTGPACPSRRNELDLASAAALAGLTGLRALSLCGLMPGRGDLDRAGAAACAAAVAALPPSLRTLTVGDVGGCAEGAALVVPPGRAQQLELRCTGELSHCLRTGQAAAGDVRAFFGWLPLLYPRITTLSIGARWRGGGQYFVIISYIMLYICIYYIYMIVLVFLRLCVRGQQTLHRVEP
jgi:hypothetical protein